MSTKMKLEINLLIVGDRLDEDARRSMMEMDPNEVDVHIGVNFGSA